MNRRTARWGFIGVAVCLQLAALAEANWNPGDDSTWQAFSAAGCMATAIAAFVNPLPKPDGRPQTAARTLRWYPKWW